MMFLVSFVLPFTVNAAEIQVWAYGTNSSEPTETAVFFNANKEVCENTRSEQIRKDTILEKVYNISDCVQVTKIDSVTIKNSDILEVQEAPWPNINNAVVPVENITEKWWSIYKRYNSKKEIVSCQILSYTTFNECQLNKKAFEENNVNVVIDPSCNKSAAQPIMPNECNTGPEKQVPNYYPLAPLPGINETCEADKTGKIVCVKTASTCTTNEKGEQTCSPGPGFANYLNVMITLFIGICAVLAMIMIIMGGIQYMTSELVSGKEAGRKQITQAILGLLLALGAYAILNTINPDLLDIGLSRLPTATISIGGESTINPTPISPTKLQDIPGIICPGTGGVPKLPLISQSFKNKITYDQSKRNTVAGDNSTIYFDCSSYISQVYSCAGLNRPGNTSADIFNDSNASTDISNIQPGDILGWKMGESGKYKEGHVVMSLGGNIIIETTGPTGVINANAHTNNDLNYYKDEIKHIIRAAGKTGPGNGSTVSSTNEEFELKITNKILSVTINPFNNIKHRITAYYPNTSTPIPTISNLLITGSSFEKNLSSIYNVIEGKTIKVSMWDENGHGIGTQRIVAP